MKPQDVIFLIIIAVIIISRKSKLFIILGIAFLFAAIPLFAKWVFFTAERLTWYAAVFFLIAIVSQIVGNRKKGD